MKGKRIKVKRPAPTLAICRHGLALSQCAGCRAAAKPPPTTTTYWPTLVMLPTVRWGWVPLR